MSWNVDDILLNWFLLILLLDRFKPSIVLLQEVRIYTNQINELAEKLPDYTIHTLLPEDLLDTMEQRLRVTRKRAKYGLVVAVRNDDPTHVKLIKKDSNSYLAIERDGMIIASIYMPQQGRGEKVFSAEMNKLAASIEKHRGNNQLLLFGDWNLSSKHKKSRQDIFDKIVDPWDIMVTKPDSYTNLIFVEQSLV